MTLQERAQAALGAVLRELPGGMVEPLAAYEVEEEAGLLRVSSGERLSLENATFSGEGNTVITGWASSARTMQGIEISGSRNVLFIGPGANISGLRVLIEGNDNRVCFGAMSTAGSVTVAVRGDGASIVVGEHSMIATRVVLGAVDRLTLYDVGTRAVIPRDKDVRIEERVWLGRDVKVEGGSTVGAHSIVGQASVVTGAIPGSSIAVGNPARVVRTGVTWGRQKDGSIEAFEASKAYEVLYARPLKAIAERLASFAERAP